MILICYDFYIPFMFGQFWPYIRFQYFFDCFCTQSLHAPLYINIFNYCYSKFHAKYVFAVFHFVSILKLTVFRFCFFFDFLLLFWCPSSFFSFSSLIFSLFFHSFFHLSSLYYSVFSLLHFFHLAHELLYTQLTKTDCVFHTHCEKTSPMRRKEGIYYGINDR